MPAAVVGLGGKTPLTEDFQGLLQGGKGQQEVALIIILLDTHGCPQPHHQILAGPVTGRHVQHFPQYRTAVTDTFNVGMHIPHSGKTLTAEIGSGIGAEAQIFLAAPVFQIVAGDLTFSAKIGDLVLALMTLFQDLDGGQIHIRLGVIVCKV